MQPYAIFEDGKCVEAGKAETPARLPHQLMIWGEAAEGFAPPAREPVAAVSPPPAPKVKAKAPAFLDGPGEAPAMPRQMKREVSRLQGYTGDDCGACGNFTMVRNGTCLKCDSCGATSGCS